MTVRCVSDTPLYGNRLALNSSGGGVPLEKNSNETTLNFRESEEQSVSINCSLSVLPADLDRFGVDSVHGGVAIRESSIFG